MPANLSPEYKAAEEEFRQARDPQARLACLERMLATIPKHKGTEKMQADLKRRIARLREEMQKSGGKKGFSVTVEKEGAAQVALVGAPNSGKSSLLESVTNARAEVADYPFSTRTPVPGMLIFENVQFQLVDLPPVSGEYMEPWVTDIIRAAHAALWVIDAADSALPRQVEELERLLAQKKIELVPAAEAGKPHDAVRRLPALVVAAKADLPEHGSGREWLQRKFAGRFPLLSFSALGDHLRELGQAVFEMCRIVRVYSKVPGREPDLSRPYVMHRGDTVLDFALQVHKDFAEKLQYARVWGKGKFEGQRVQRDQLLEDGDVIELHI
jgi:ribosome-interacting GTPase 1